MPLLCAYYRAAHPSRIAALEAAYAAAVERRKASCVALARAALLARAAALTLTPIKPDTRPAAQSSVGRPERSEPARYAENSLPKPARKHRRQAVARRLARECRLSWRWLAFRRQPVHQI